MSLRTNIQRQRMTAKEGEVLPKGFQRCEYIESHGREFINTFYAPKDTNEIQIQFQQVSIFGSYPKLFGSEYANRSLSYKLDLRGNYTVGYSNNEFQITIPVGTGINDVVFKKGVLIVNGRVVTYSPQPLGTSPYPLYLFSSNRSNQAIEFSANRIFAMTIKEGENPVVDLIPALDDTGIPCMYDAIRKMIFYNLGAGGFSYKLA